MKAKNDKQDDKPKTKAKGASVNKVQQVKSSSWSYGGIGEFFRRELPFIC